jgi:non-canonical purine NTP pyrophosphatase (RdgB/HAM1 family)
MLYFITGNKNKLAEVRAILGEEVGHLDIDLPEIQEIDAHEIIKAKLQEAFRHAEGEFIVEDTSLYLDGLNGLPGPLIKWFLQALGTEGLADLAERLGNAKATARTVIGYARNREDIRFFEGNVSGSIVKPRVPSAFGWDPIFLPDGYDKTYAEMEKEEKNRMSHRRLALDKLKEFLVADANVGTAQDTGNDNRTTDCRDEDGITVGLVDAIISIVRVLAKKDLDAPDVREALKDLAEDEDLRKILEKGKQ